MMLLWFLLSHVLHLRFVLPTIKKSQHFHKTISNINYMEWLLPPFHMHVLLLEILPNGRVGSSRLFLTLPFYLSETGSSRVGSNSARTAIRNVHGFRKLKKWHVTCSKGPLQPYSNDPLHCNSASVQASGQLSNVSPSPTSLHHWTKNTIDPLNWLSTTFSTLSLFTLKFLTLSTLCLPSLHRLVITSSNTYFVYTHSPCLHFVYTHSL